MITNERWQEVTKGEPCPVCEKPDWCRVSPDGTKAACRRESISGRRKVYRDGSEAYIHDLQPNVTQARDNKPKRRGRKKTADSPIAKPKDNGTPAADADQRDNAYRALLAALELSLEHRRNLQRRGLPDGQIDAAGYRTWNQDNRSLSRISDKTGGDRWNREFETVPGFGPGIRFNAPSGLLIPVCDLAGRIMALCVRLDNPANRTGKYRWVSSRSDKRPDAPSPGSPAHVPMGIRGLVKLARVLSRIAGEQDEEYGCEENGVAGS